MKVSNNKSIERKGAILLLLLPILTILIIVYLLTAQKFDFTTVVYLILQIIIIYTILQLRVKDFENSGFVVTVKLRHPLSKICKSRLLFEFPLNILEDYELKKNILYLKISIAKPLSEKSHIIKFPLSGFNRYEIEQILDSLPDN